METDKLIIRVDGEGRALSNATLLTLSVQIRCHGPTLPEAQEIFKQSVEAMDQLRLRYNTVPNAGPRARPKMVITRGLDGPTVMKCGPRVCAKGIESAAPTPEDGHAQDAGRIESGAPAPESPKTQQRASAPVIFVQRLIPWTLHDVSQSDRFIKDVTKIPHTRICKMNWGLSQRTLDAMAEDLREQALEDATARARAYFKTATGRPDCRLIFVEDCNPDIVTPDPGTEPDHITAQGMREIILDSGRIKVSRRIRTEFVAT